MYAQAAEEKIRIHQEHPPLGTPPQCQSRIDRNRGLAYAAARAKEHDDTAALSSRRCRFAENLAACQEGFDPLTQFGRLKRLVRILFRPRLKAGNLLDR